MRCCPLVAVSQRISSSGRRSDLSCASGLSDVPVASSTVSVLAFGAADLGGGSRECTGRSWQRCVPEGFIPLSSSCLCWPAPRHCRGFPRRPFHVCDSFHGTTAVLCQSPDCSRAENRSLAPNNVFVCVRVAAQPTAENKLCLAFLQVRYCPPCQNQLSQTVTQVERMFPSLIFEYGVVPVSAVT